MVLNIQLFELVVFKKKKYEFYTLKRCIHWFYKRTKTINMLYGLNNYFL